MASLLDLAQARLQGLLDIPTRVGRAVVNPTLFSGLLGAPTLPKETGMAQAAYGLPAQPNMSVLDPEQRAYLEGYAQGEPYSYLGMAAPFAAPAVAAGAKAVAPKAGMALENYMASQGLLQPIMTYHASPYKFEKFDPSKVGTGEGAQAYGVGAGYVAQNPKVANEYFRAFTDVESAPLMYKGKRVDTPWNEDISQRWADVIEKNKFTQEQIEDFQGVLGNLSQVNLMQDVPAVVKGLSKDQQKMFEKYIKPELTKPENIEAYMYKVDVNDEIVPKMLDWDKPISEQPKQVRNMIADMAKETSTWQDYVATIKPATKKLAEEMLVGEKPTTGLESAKFWKKLEKLDPNANHNAIWDSLYDVGITKNENLISGSQFYNELSRQLGSPQKASDFMQSKGVTGIKYFDAFSRKDAPNPTYNFVPFDPEDMKIKEVGTGLLD
jgi:hypothetical protein